VSGPHIIIIVVIKIYSEQPDYQKIRTQLCITESALKAVSRRRVFNKKLSYWRDRLRCDKITDTSTCRSVNRDRNPTYSGLIISSDSNLQISDNSWRYIHVMSYLVIVFFQWACPADRCSLCNVLVFQVLQKSFFCISSLHSVQKKHPIFSRSAMLERDGHRRHVRLSVCPSVTRW